MTIVERLGLGRKLIGGIIIAILVIFTPYLACNLFENVQSGHIVVIQSPWSGELTVYNTEGVKWQGFGTVTVYPRAGTFQFEQPVNPYSENSAELARYNKAEDKSFRITFNDSGEAYVSGSIRYEYPTDIEKMKEIHRMFYGHDSVMLGLIEKTMERAIYMSGPLMPSIDSIMSRRSELPTIIEDQARNGLYCVITKDQLVLDEFTGEKKFIKTAEPIKNEQSPNGLMRQDISIVGKYGMSLSNLSIRVNYHPNVQRRADALFASNSDIQIATMNAKKAEQDRRTATEQGQAAATTAEWKAKAISSEKIEQGRRDKEIAVLDAEKLKAVAVLDAQKKFEVAELDKKTAIAYKDAQIQRAEGDSTYKRKLMEADGALGQRLDTYLKSQELWANAFGTYRGNLVPSIIMGNSGTQTSTATDFMNMMMMKSAKDLMGPDGLQIPRNK